MRERLVTALHGLPERERTALFLHDLRGLSCAEIAHELGLTEGTASRLLVRGRDNLRQQLSTRMSCERAQELRGSAAGANLTPGEVRAAKAHLLNCPRCETAPAGAFGLYGVLVSVALQLQKLHRFFAWSLRSGRSGGSAELLAGSAGTGAIVAKTVLVGASATLAGGLAWHVGAPRHPARPVAPAIARSAAVRSTAPRSHSTGVPAAKIIDSRHVLPSAHVVSSVEPSARRAATPITTASITPSIAGAAHAAVASLSELRPRRVRATLEPSVAPAPMGASPGVVAVATGAPPTPTVPAPASSSPPTAATVAAPMPSGAAGGDPTVNTPGMNVPVQPGNVAAVATSGRSSASPAQVASGPAGGNADAGNPVVNDPGAGNADTSSAGAANRAAAAARQLATGNAGKHVGALKAGSPTAPASAAGTATSTASQVQPRDYDQANASQADATKPMDPA